MARCVSPATGDSALPPGPAGVPGSGRHWTSAAGAEVSQGCSGQEDCRGQSVESVVTLCTCVHV